MVYLVVTLGCKVNQSESGGMGELLRAKGHVAASEGVSPDIVIINTCTVTAAADRKSRALIRRMGRLYPDAVLGVCGCLSQTERLDLPGVALYGGSADKTGFISRLEEAASARFADKSPLPQAEGFRYAPFPFPDSFEALPDAPPEGRTRLFLKIQDGCENHCAYCRVPKARGPCRSRPEAEVLAAAKRAKDADVPELVLCGIEISSYCPSLAELTEHVCRTVPSMRVRLGSLYPTLADDDFCTQLKPLSNLCPHFHLSLQSGCDETLRRMGRRYGSQDIAELFRRLRDTWDKPAISCDILCGFPGETEEEFRETFSLLARLRPARLHVFPYSRRAGTAAAAMEGQISGLDKRSRAAKLQALDKELRNEYALLFAGTEQEVLFEDQAEGVWSGHTTRYVPVTYRSAEDLHAVTLRLRFPETSSGGAFKL